ncbi:signal peptidase I [Ruminococcus flavefaciens]|uniref:signal peptidase I n=1 Tax=Ruminococcus flavefaciens TaxID=1265 RepID=UPI0004651EC5|nr:signal peptidase I [Ruminococcus flavefaciens]
MSTIAKEVTGKGNSKGFYVYTIIRKVFIYCLSIFIVVAAVFFAASKSPNKSILGFRYYIVLTDSMVPEFSSGDMVFVKRTDAETINEGDIITFNPSSGSDAYLTHRVTEKIADYENTGVICFRTKGDANDAEDTFLIDESRVIGKVQFHIPKLGRIVRFVQLRWYFILPLIALLFVFFRMMKYYFDLKGKENSDQIDQNNMTEIKNN